LITVYCPGWTERRRQLVDARLELPSIVELRQVGVGAVRDDGARHPVHADTDALEVIPHPVEELERMAKVGAALPAAVVRLLQRFGGSQHLDRETEPIRNGGHVLRYAGPVPADLTTR
jgi:hypothetical protein